MTQNIKKGGGVQNVLIDILSTAGTRNTALLYSSSVSITYIRSDQSSSTAITLVAGTLGSIVDSGFIHYSNGIYQLGLPADAALTGKSVLVQWSGSGLTTGEKLIPFQGTATGFADSISFSTDNIIKLRYLIDDLDESAYVYSDDRLAQLFTVAACYVKPDISATYVVSISEGSITPDPSESTLNLITLKAACMLSKAEMKSNTGSDIRVTDGPTVVDYKGINASMKSTSQTFCEDYNRALSFYLMADTNVGQAILTPKGLG